MHISSAGPIVALLAFFVTMSSLHFVSVERRATVNSVRERDGFLEQEAQLQEETLEPSQSPVASRDSSTSNLKGTNNTGFHENNGLAREEEASAPTSPIATSREVTDTDSDTPLVSSSVAAETVSEMEPLSFPSLSDPETSLVKIINNTGLSNLATKFFQGQVCRDIVMVNDTTIEQYQTHSTVVNITFSCNDLFKNGAHGTGNFITAFYGVRMAAHALGMTDVVIQCSDAEATKSSLILPWMMGTFPRLSADSPGDTEELQDQPTWQRACESYLTVPIGYRWRDMVFELRRMAIAMVGIPSPDHPSAKWAQQNLWSQSEKFMHGRDRMQLRHPGKDEEPLFPNTEIDDAVLHFRCGDIIMSNHPSFGFMKFGSFSRHLDPDVKTIGVVTQPFEAGAQQRKAEGGQSKRERCKLVVYAFMDHLRVTFPDAKISLHNSIDETIALTFARLIMAKQTVVGITSFGVFPGVATFGRGYIREPDYRKAPNRWLQTSPILEHLDNVQLIKEPRLMAGPLKRRWGNDGAPVLEWFRNYTMAR